MSGRRDGVFAAVTAVLVLMVGVAFVVTRGTSDADRDTPWLASVAPSGPAACGSGDLVAGRHTTSAAAGTAYLTASLELAPDVEPCAVGGYPGVIVLSGGVPAGVSTVPDESLGRARGLVVLPDRPVRVTLSWAVSHYCGGTVNDALRLRVAPGLTVEVPGFGATSCNPGEGRPPVRVGSFTYVDPNAERGTVTGVVTLNDGPEPGTGEYVTSGVVEFNGDPDGYDAPIGPQGAYELDLPAGRYQVTVTTHQWNGGTSFSAGAFVVTGGELNELNITLPLR